MLELFTIASFFGLFILIIPIRDLFPNRNTVLLIFLLTLVSLLLLLTIIYCGFLTIFRKFLGLILIFFGLFMITNFPRPEEYQPSSFSKLGLFVGFFSFLLGTFLILS